MEKCPELALLSFLFRPLTTALYKCSHLRVKEDRYFGAVYWARSVGAEGLNLAVLSNSS